MSILEGGPNDPRPPQSVLFFFKAPGVNSLADVFFVASKNMNM